MRLVLASQMLRERRRLVMWTVVGGGVILLLQLLLYPSMRGALEEMNSVLPDGFADLVGTAELASIEGFMHAEAFGTLAPGLAIAVAVSLGAMAIAGQEESGALASIATAPISRHSMVVAAALAISSGLAAVASGYLVAALVGLAVIGETVAVSRVLAVVVALFLFGSMLGSIALAVGAATGRRGLAVGIASAVAVGSYVNYAVVPLADGFEWARRWSLWFPYAASEPLRNGVDPLHLCSMAAITLAGWFVADRALNRRDIAH